jgi:hypothetical protein
VAARGHLLLDGDHGALSGVWSQADHTFRKATDYFISDAWAIQRRRGIKETARTKGTTTG